MTVYAEDDEALRHLDQEIGVPAERCIRIGDNKGARYASDNFWMMATPVPAARAPRSSRPRRPISAGKPRREEDGDRYIEIWNNVFMQFNRDENGVMHPLPKLSVDTGMGLERIAAVLQGVTANYEIDLFQALIAACRARTQRRRPRPAQPAVLADHIRACAFLTPTASPATKGAATCCAASSAAPSATAGSSARAAFFHRMVPTSSPRWATAYPELAQGTRRA